MQNSNDILGVWSVNKKVINGFLQNMAHFIENNHGYEIVELYFKFGLKKGMKWAWMGVNGPD